MFHSTKVIKIYKFLLLSRFFSLGFCIKILYESEIFYYDCRNTLKDLLFLTKFKYRYFVVFNVSYLCLNSNSKTLIKYINSQSFLGFVQTHHAFRKKELCEWWTCFKKFIEILKSFYVLLIITNCYFFKHNNGCEKNIVFLLVCKK